MSDILYYITSDGSQREKRYDVHDSTIDLSNLDILHFDTSQLMSNNLVRELRLNSNNIERLDITPLVSCKKLGTLILDGETDAETLLSYETMEDIAKEVLLDAVETFDALTFLPSLTSIKASYDHVRRNEPDWKMIHLFQNSLRVIGFGWIGMFDIGLKESMQILKQLLDSGNLQKIQDRLLSLLAEKIDNGNPTIDLDIQMMKHYGDLVMRIDDVVEQRTDEMQNQFVTVMAFPIDKESIVLLESVGESVDTHYADLRMLWLTAYGFELLESLSMGTTCELREFSKIQNALSSLGFDLKTNLDPRPYPIIGWKNREVLLDQGIESPEPKIELPKQLSYEMMEYIWQLAEFRSNASMTLIAASSDDTIKIDLSRLE
ncbi:MAG: hypothetical protein RTV31_06570 [Candidatus Thorarchaeota archaeon]